VGNAEGWFERLDTSWERGIPRWTGSPGPLTVLFSGGVDSGLLAWELRFRPQTSLHTVGAEGSRDLATAESAAREIGLPWSGTVLAPGEVLRAANELAAELRGLDANARSVQVAVALAVRSAPASVLLCGQGVDELFLGYAHFRGSNPSEQERRAHVDLERLTAEDWPRTVRIARSYGRAIEAPFLAGPFLAAAESIPLAERAPSPRPKELFRAWARHRGLPVSLCDRPKRAFQFGSGVHRILRQAGGHSGPGFSVR
jgi:asparagine synthase (glutamine-hydrolysing)